MKRLIKAVVGIVTSLMFFMSFWPAIPNPFETKNAIEPTYKGVSIQDQVGEAISNVYEQGVTTLSELTSKVALPTVEIPTFSDFFKSDVPSVERPVLPELVFDGTNQVIAIDQSQADFSAEELSLSNGSWQTFSDLDQLNRVGVANAMLGRELFPTEEREPLNVNPTGWNQKKLSDGKWLYNRCHLIGFQLTGENNNLKNLMTGTRSFNTPGMLEYENKIADYLKKTSNHIRYQVTPIFEGTELVARGVQLKAKSVEDDQVNFNVYIFNNQTGVSIDYQNGRATLP